MRKILLLLFVFTLFACKKTVVVKKTDTNFNDNQWMATDIKTFEFKLKRNVEAADINIVFSHVFDPQYSTVPMSVTVENPAGEKENVFVNLMLKDEEGNDLSDCSGDICDLIQPIKEDVTLQKGTYKVSIENKFAYEYLANVLAVGVSVDRED